MGVVYEAYDLLKRNIVAVKRTFRTAGVHADLFFREAALLAQLNHPGLPKVDDYFSDREELFLVMEFIEGDDLLTLLSQQGKPLATEIVLKWADELFDALIYLHTLKPQIIHRDIKPENIKLAHNLKIKLLDFGLAKNVETKSAPNSILGGTEGYAPPEQFIKGDTVDPRADIYALGATFYHLLTGTIPTTATTRLECSRFQSPDPMRKAHEVNRDVPVAVSAVIAKAITLDRNLRYQTAADMRQALHEACRVVLASDSLPSTIINPLSEMPNSASEVSCDTAASQQKVYLIKSAPLTCTLDYGGFIGEYYVAGTEFEYTRIESNGFYLVMSTNNEERWVTDRDASIVDPRTFFRIKGRDIVGYLVGTMYPDASGGNTTFININDTLLGEVKIPIKQIRSISVNSKDVNAPLVVEISDGNKYAGTSKLTPRYAGASHNTYLIRGTSSILLETAKEIILEPVKDVGLATL